MKLFGLFLAVTLSLGCSDDSEDPPARDGWWGFGDYTATDITQGSCTSTSCAGCCMGTACVTGNDPQACGYGGIPCQQCTSTETCQMGFCTPSSTCDTSSCPDGCCDNAGQCQTGTADTACGSGGGTCQSCDTDKVCSQAGKCVAKGSGSYQLVLVSLKIKDSWTVCGWSGLYPEGTCDPYVEVELGTSKGTSSVKIDSHTPTWNEQLFVASESDLTTKKLTVSVKDEDTGPDETIGVCYPNITTADLTAGQIVENCGANVTDLTFEFKAN